MHFTSTIILALLPLALAAPILQPRDDPPIAGVPDEKLIADLVKAQLDAAHAPGAGGLAGFTGPLGGILSGLTGGGQSGKAARNHITSHIVDYVDEKRGLPGLAARSHIASHVVDHVDEKRDLPGLGGLNLGGNPGATGGGGAGGGKTGTLIDGIPVVGPVVGPLAGQLTGGVLNGLNLPDVKGLPIPGFSRLGKKDQQ